MPGVTEAKTPVATHKQMAVRATLAVLLSYAVIFVTLLVTVHNLGAREDIGYINGGKVFRQTGTMWYHVPGLQEIGLAPQNIGAQINLRNNEFAMLERDLSTVDRIEVDFELAENALLLIILDRHREGTFWAVRLTAFSKESSPFVNALVRYEKGRVVQRIPLSDLGRALPAGEHSASVELTGEGNIVVTVGATSQSLPFDVHTIQPKLALGCGELNTTIFRWAVTGSDEDGQRFEWEESFSMARTYDTRSGALAVLALLIWAILLGGPLLKVVLETRLAIWDVLSQALLMPTPRWFFGLLCIQPWMPMVLQWILGGLYLVYAHMTIWDELARGRLTWRVASPDGVDPKQTSKQRARWGIVAGALLAGSLALFGLRSAVLWSPVGDEQSFEAGTPVTGIPGLQPLRLGERILSDFSDRGGDAQRVTFDVQLGEREVLRADLLRAAPPTTADVYQVDRSQDKPVSDELGFGPGSMGGPDDDGPNGPEGEDGQQGEENGGDAGDYEMRAVSVFVSSDSDLPGNLRWLSSDKINFSPHMGWVLDPGTHRVVVTVSPPIATVAVNGTLVDMRTDIDPTFRTGAVQLLSMSDQVSQVGELRIEKLHADALGDEHMTTAVADFLGVPALLLLVLGLLVLVIWGLTRLPFDRATALGVVKRALRASTLLAIWLGYWLAERMGVVDWSDELIQITIGVFGIGFLLFNAGQILRQSDPERPPWRRFGSLVAIVVMGVFVFEGMSALYPERRFNWTHYWSHQLGPRYYFVHDPMIRRLNPWFIDQRFKRQDWKPEHKDKVRVVVFGGSQTYGWGIPAMDRMNFSDQLERALHQKGYPQIEVLNAAFPGVKTATGLRWFSSNLLRYQPDIVVVNFVVNEFMNVDQYHVWSGDRAPDDSISALASLALLERWRGDAMGNHLSQIIVADVYEIYAMERYLRWWVNVANEHGVKLVFSIEPTNLYVESGGDSIMRSEQGKLGDAQAMYRRLGAELGVPVYDVLPFFKQQQEDMLFYDTMHMSRLGHEVFAKNLAELIEREVLNIAVEAPPNKTAAQK